MKKILTYPLGLLLGTVMIPMAFIIKLIGFDKDLSPGISAPYGFGFIKNLMYACSRLSYADIRRRAFFILKNPPLAIQYLMILFTEKKMRFMGEMMVPIDSLIPSHDVSTNHKHHRMRVEMALCGLVLGGANEIVVLDGKIQDGHHRVAAYREAGVKEVKVSYWVSSFL